MNSLQHPSTNLGLIFSEQQRKDLGVKGLLPPRVHSLDTEIQRVMDQLREIPLPLDKYIYLQGLQNINETLFYAVLLSNIIELMPLVYTPVVGSGCVFFSKIFRQPRGMWISIKDAGNVENILRNWRKSVQIIVVTDGERILGLGDLGANGMGIPIGKLILYSACAGIHPDHCLPITLDCGTNNEKLRNDPMYIGNPHPRVRGEEYDRFIDEFMHACDRVFNSPLIQFEDFANLNSFRLLDKYRNQLCTFNDDIQGTAAAGVGGLFGASRLLNNDLASQKILFLGAGAAGLGIADLIVQALVKQGIPKEKAQQTCWFIDSKGLVIKSRIHELKDEKIPFAHEASPSSSLLDCIQQIRPTCIIGVSGQPLSFDQQVITEMAKINEHPIIFALSNPTSKSECTAEQAYTWSDGRAIFASGSPFDPVKYKGKIYTPGQGNNSYIFPGVGLGVIVSKSKRVTDSMFLAAAKALSDQVSLDELNQGRIYPSLERIRDVSLQVAVAVAEVAFDTGLAQVPRPNSIIDYVREAMYDPFQSIQLLQSKL